MESAAAPVPAAERLAGPSLRPSPERKDTVAVEVASLLAGDPLPAPLGITRVRDLQPQVPEEMSGGRVRSLGPGVVLWHDLSAPDGPLTLRWVPVAHAPVLEPVGAAVRTVLVLHGPVSESGRALRAVASLKACISDGAFSRRAEAATTRAGLVDALVAAARRLGEALLSTDEVTDLLGTSPRGLDDGEAARRLRACGPNRLERAASRPLWRRLLDELTAFFAILLWVAGACALLAGLPALALAIFVVIVVNGVFSFLQEYRAEQAVEALERLLPSVVTAVRAGRRESVAVEELVPGDVVELEAGDRVPADGYLLEAVGLRVDQSLLTGESRCVFKSASTGTARRASEVAFSERQEQLFGGTAVAAGRGTLVVTATAMATEIGRVAGLTQQVRVEASPLQREMAAVTRVVTALALASGVVFFALGVGSGLMSASYGFVFALGVIVANVPEGLLPTLTLSLALGVERMARRGTVVKRLSAVESLGATTVIVTDKTGTLTRNRMEARTVWAGGKEWPLQDFSAPLPAPLYEVLEALVLASDATAQRGDPTERALVAAAERLGVEVEAERRRQRLLAPFSFDSFRKRMTLVRQTERGPRAYVKGAPAEVLARCRSWRTEGQTRPLDEAVRARILEVHDRMARSGLRLLASATRSLSTAIDWDADRVECDLAFLGLVALWDPPRPEVAPALAECRGAGIRVLMVTGDDGLTAQAVARDVGLPAETVVTGWELDRLPAEGLRRLLLRPGVIFARTSPSQKLDIVTALRGLGEVVAVTGDGVNDAPALRAADVGVAMGQRGSEVAKEAAAMVVLDDDFGSVVTAIRQGRATYANMGKFVTYIFASNVPELVPFLASVLFGLPLALTVMQILAVDLGTDLWPALALGTEEAEPGLMQRPPRRRGDRLLGAARLFRAYGFLGLVEAALAMTAFFWPYWRSGWRPGDTLAAAGELYQRATTLTLAAIVAAQVGNAFACRTERVSVFRVGLFGNRRLLAGIAAELGMLVALVYVRPLAALFGLRPLLFADWVFLVPFPFVVLSLEEARKLALRTVLRRAPGGES